MPTKAKTLILSAAAAAFMLGACAMPSEASDHRENASGEAAEAHQPGESARDEAAEHETDEAGEASEANETASHGDPALQRLAHVSPDQAQHAALAVRPGAISDWELERETGGSGLRYSFDITTPQGVFEVGIDAANGAVLENAPADND